MGVASNIIGQPLKLKHFFGLLHASVWLILPFLETDEDLVDTALLYSLFYYLQDTVWSIGLGQYSMAAHHIVLCTFWFFLVWKRLKFKEELLLSCMFFAEIGSRNTSIPAWYSLGCNSVTMFDGIQKLLQLCDLITQHLNKLSYFYNFFWIHFLLIIH